MSAFSFFAYAVALAASISVWFIAIRAPLWLDETSSYWQISGGFRHIAARQGITFAAHSYILWAFSLILGKSEVALRLPEVLATLASAYVLYRIASEMFEKDVALITVVIFCLHPVLVFASIDARPYAFGLLAINCAILCLVRLRNSDSLGWAAAFGLCAAFIPYFHLLFSVILLPLLWCFVAFKIRNPRVLWRQLAVALITFALAVLPVVSRFGLMFRTGHTLIVEHPPHFSALLLTLVPSWPLLTYGFFFIIAVAIRNHSPGVSSDWRLLICLSLALFPVIVLYAVSVTTPLQVFVERYRLVAVPGIALCWGFLVSAIHSRTIRLIFCLVVVAAVVSLNYADPHSRRHGYTWKYALQFAEKNASADGAPVVLCSDFPQSAYLPMPVGDAVKDSAMFTPLSYYKLSVPVVGLPRGLNEEAKRDGRNFLDSAVHRRFLALGFWPSQPVLHWMSENAAATHTVRELGKFDNITVLEFTPRN